MTDEQILDEQASEQSALASARYWGQRSLPSHGVLSPESGIGNRFSCLGRIAVNGRAAGETFA